MASRAKERSGRNRKVDGGRSNTAWRADLEISLDFILGEHEGFQVGEERNKICV